MTKRGAVLSCLCLAVGCAWPQDGGNTRYLPDKPGFWQPQQYLGEHGAGAAAAEVQAITANLKRIQAVLMATPIGANPVGFYYLSSPMWYSRGRTLAIHHGLAIFPLAFVEFRKQGVWTLDMHGETESVDYSINQLDEIERVSSKIFEEQGPNGAVRAIYLAPQRAGSLGGFPVYGDTLFLSRPGRELFRQITLERALKAAMPVYTTSRDAAEREVAAAKQRNKDFKADEYEQKELAKFEKEWGKLRTTDMKDYEEHKRAWMAPVLRVRREHDAAAALPVRGDKKSEWYFGAIDEFAGAQRRLAGLTPQEAASPACYEPADVRRPYAMQGQIRSGTAGTTCLPLVETNPAYYDRALPRTAVQLITVTSITRCAAFRGGTLVSSSNHTYAGGCLVHARMWQELNWQKLADLLVR